MKPVSETPLNACCTAANLVIAYWAHDRMARPCVPIWECRVCGCLTLGLRRAAA